MEHTTETQWMGKMQFNALINNNHTLIMDGPTKVGGEDLGPIPKPLLLTALSGCTGMDVIALLKKANIEPQDFSVNVQGILSKEAPITYTSIHLNYVFKGKESEQKEALQAVQLSQEKYCGVSAMLKKIIPVTWEINYNGERIYDNSSKYLAA